MPIRFPVLGFQTSETVGRFFFHGHGDVCMGHFPCDNFGGPLLQVVQSSSDNG